MLDYDAEADTYDATRGGLPRAQAAASAVAALLPAAAQRVADVGAGTGIVSAESARRRTPAWLLPARRRRPAAPAHGQRRRGDVRLAAASRAGRRPAPRRGTA